MYYNKNIKLIIYLALNQKQEIKPKNMNKKINELMEEIKQGNVSQEEMLNLLKLINGSLSAYKDFLQEVKVTSSIQEK